MANTKDKEDSKVRSKLLNLSASRVDTYEKCPRKYYYRYVEKLPTKEWSHLTLGIYVHRALELFHARHNRTGVSDLRKLMGECSRDAFQEFTKEGKTLSAEDLAAAKNMMADYLARVEIEGMPNVLSVEERFTVPLTDQFDLVGVVDRIDQDPDGVYHIKDYKTSKSARYLKPFQLNTYGLHLLSRYPDADRFRASYIMLRLSGRDVSFEFTAEDVSKCRETLIKRAESITSEERWITRPTRLCDWCDFKDVCMNSW
jgi:RecB family exonuclease